MHRDFCEVAIAEAGRVRRARRVETTPAALELFAQSLAGGDQVALEVTRNALAIAWIIEPHVGRVVLANPKAVKNATRSAKTDKLDARTLARLLAAGFLAEVWPPDERTRALQAESASRAHVRTREVDSGCVVSNHSCMPASARCGALLRDGQPCRRTVAAGSEFCVHHTKLLGTVNAETMRQGRTPKRHSTLEPVLRVVTDGIDEPEARPTVGPVAIADPATVRPLLAAAAAENVEQLKSSLLEAAGSAVKPVWLTVECAGCGERSRIEAPVPDVRARVAAIELLLREGLGRPATAEEVRSPRIPASVAAVKAMSWDDMQNLFAATYVDEIATIQRQGGRALLRQRLAVLSDSERRALRAALSERRVRCLTGG